MLASILALFGMPCLLVLLTVVGGRRLRDFPGRDDLWTIPRVPPSRGRLNALYFADRAGAHYHVGS